MTSVQSFSVAVRRRMSYLKDVTISSGFTYNQNAAATPAHDSSYAIHFRFLSASYVHSAIVG